MELEVIDQRLVQELFKNGRAPLSRIAKACRVSKEVIHYRLKRLQQKGILQGVISVINPFRLGYQVYFVFFKLRKIDNKREKEITEALAKSKFTILVLTCTGNWDIFVEFYARDAREYQFIMETFIFILGENTAEYSSAMALELFSEPHAYLFKEKNIKIESHRIISKNEKVKFDKDDKKILHILRDDGRATLVEMGKRIGLSLDTIKYRLRRMSKQGIIDSFRPNINVSLLGYTWYIVNLWLNKIDEKRRKMLLSFLRTHPHIFFIAPFAEPNRLQFELMVRSAREFRQILMEIRGIFGDIIERHDSLLVFDEHKFTYIPEAITNPE